MVEDSRRAELFRAMARIRRFETRTAELYRDAQIPGFVHVSVGQEAVAVGVCGALRADDIITSTHRGHGHMLAKGGDMPAMFAELMAKDAGSCRGRGGSMHIADPRIGIFGANGIVGAGLPIAGGAAVAAALDRSDRVVVSFFGDGAVGQGTFHEAINLASVLSLPVIFVCENNHFAEFTNDENLRSLDLARRAEGYGVPYFHVDGNDAEAVRATAEKAIATVRGGGGPVFIEAETYRMRGHYEGDPQSYRPDGDLERWSARDPLEVLRARLLEEGASAEELDAIIDDVTREVEEAVAFARAAPPPAEETLDCYVTEPGPSIEEPAAIPADVEQIRTSKAIRSALQDELEDNPDSFIAGIDVGRGGNVFAITRGLFDQFPDRVIDTPISESAIMGIGVGAAMSGKRPIVELMYVDFLGVCLDQLMNQAAKMRLMTGGGASVPMVVRTQFGAGRSSGAQHSQSLEAIFAHIPGLKVVMPSTPADAYGLLRAAQLDPNPVVFIEHRLLYEVKGPRPPRGHLVPLGKALVRRPGADITIVTMSRMVHVCLAVAAELAEDGIECEVIDLRTISPLDHTTVLTSVEKTSRLLIVHEAVTDFGIGAEIAARIADEGFMLMDAPIKRIGALPMPAPYAPNLERLWLPDAERIRAQVKDLVSF